MQLDVCNGINETEKMRKRRACVSMIYQLAVCVEICLMLVSIFLKVHVYFLMVKNLIIRIILQFCSCTLLNVL